MSEGTVTKAEAYPKETLDAVRKQIEYYFSDSNFRRDKFLKAKVGEDADGFVQLSVLSTFNRLKEMKATGLYL